jgi:HAD superfamily hydrolase (TIGR01509 family)
MYKLLIFDLDGVLVDSKEVHSKALSDAIQMHSPDHVLSNAAQSIIQMAIPTIEKLSKIGFDKVQIEEISAKKQELTAREIAGIHQDKKLIKLLQKASQKFYVAVASNSHTLTVKGILSQLGILDYVNFYIGNDQVSKTKPNPEMFLACMNHFKVASSETVVFEDSPVGLMAARLSGASVVQVQDSKDLKKKLRKYVH